MEKSNNYNSIDLFKLIMAICVVAIHTNPLYSCDNKTAVSIYNTVVGAANPFFFLSSGFLIGKTYFGGGQNNYYILQHLKKLLKLYLIWTLIYCPLAIYYYCNNGSSVLFNAADFIRGLLFVGEHYNSYALWYLLSCVYGLLFIYMLLKRHVGFSKIVIICNTLMIFGFVFTELVVAKDLLPAFLGIPTKILWIILGPRGRIFMGAGYISIGMLLAKYDEKTKKKYALLILGAIVTTLTSGFAKSLAFVYLSTSLFSVVKNMNFGHNKLSLICRRCSTVMYFLHLWVWTLYYICVYGEKKYGLDSFIVTTCMSFILGVLFSAYKDKWLKKCLREE